MLRRAALFAAPLVLVAQVAHADRRAFTQTYEYMTMPENDTEVELYSDQARVAHAHEFGLELEIEHGITERWDAALYAVFSQGQDSALRFDAAQLETRYRFAERGDWPVDVEVYGEGAKDFGAQRYRGEGRVILERDFDKLAAVVNLVGEDTFGPDVATNQLELGWAGGLSYEAWPELKVGAESWGAFDAKDTSTLTAYAGPAVSWAPSTSLWATLTPGFRVDDTAAKDYDVRVAIGLHVY